MKALLMTLLFPAVLAAQAATKTDPAINARFREPDLEELVDSLESADRNVYHSRYAIVSALGLQPGDDVADVGAGTGFLTRMMAKEVGPHGRAYAVEIAEEMVAHIVNESREEGLENVVGILGDDRTTNLPDDAIDVALVCYVYHHFENPTASLGSIERALRPDGRLVVIERERIKGVTPDANYVHLRAGKGTFTDEILDAGFELEKELPFLVANSYTLVFKKRGH